jgi:hypothetical protein
MASARLYLPLSALLISAPVLVSYLGTQARVQTGIADSDEILGTSYLNSVTHPPGYPLFTSLLYWWLRLPFGTVATAGHTFNALVSAVNIGLLFYFLTIFLSRVKPLVNRTYVHFITSALTSFGLAWSFEYWFHSNFIEVFQFHLMLILLFWICQLLWHFELNKIGKIRWWYVTMALVGLGLSHQQTFILALPGFLYLVYLAMKKGFLPREAVIWGLMLALFSFLLAYGLMFTKIESSQWSWVKPDSFAEYIQYLTRFDFRKTGSMTSLTAYVSEISLPAILRNGWLYGSTILFRSYSLWFVLSMVLGLPVVVLLRKAPLIRWLMLNLFFVSLFTATYLDIPDQGNLLNYFQQLTLNKRFYLMSYLPLGVLASLGISFLLLRLQDRFSMGTKRAALWGGGIIVSLCGWTYVSHREAVDLSHYTMVQSWTTEIAQQVDTGTIYCFSDLGCFSLLYASVVEPKAAFQVVPPTGKITTMMNLENHRSALDPWKSVEMLTAINSSQAIYVVEIQEELVEQLGMDGRFLRLEPAGFVHKVACDQEQPLVLAHTRFGPTWGEKRWDERASGAQLFLETVALHYALNAQLLQQRGELISAAGEIDAGLALKPTHRLLQALAQELLYAPSEIRQTAKTTCEDSAFWRSLAYECEQYDKPACQLQYAWWVVLIEPQNATNWYYLGEVLEIQAENELAREAYEQANKADPNYLPAKEKLTRYLLN